MSEKAAGAVAARRLLSQRIAAGRLAAPEDVVRWMGALQAQEYPASLWAAALRTEEATEADVEAAVAERRIVRTWPMRGTLHFVPAEDARWMVELLAPRVIALTARRYRQLELDDRVLGHAGEVVSRALEGGRRLTRPELYRLLEANGIAGAGTRGMHICAYLAQAGRICFGPREGKQPTFVLLHEWVPKPRKLAREEALAELALRYFRSHGPATLHDFGWWAGLRMRDVREAVAAAGSALAREPAGGREMWFADDAGAGDGPVGAAPDPPDIACLLPAFDEYTVAYQDRSDLLAPGPAEHVLRGGMIAPVLVVAGRVAATWRRVLRKREVVVTLTPFGRLTRRETDAAAAAAERYGRFLGLTGVLG